MLLVVVVIVICKIMLWLLVGWLVQLLKLLEGHTHDVCAVAISVDGGKIVSGSKDSTVQVWSMETGEVCLACILHLFMFGGKC